MVEEKTLDDFDIHKTAKSLKNVIEWSEGLGDAAEIVKILVNQKSISKGIEYKNEKHLREIEKNKLTLKELQETVITEQELEAAQRSSTAKNIEIYERSLNDAQLQARSEIQSVRTACEIKIAGIKEETEAKIAEYREQAAAAVADTAKAVEELNSAEAAYSKFKESIK